MTKSIPVPVAVAILVGILIAIVFFAWKAVAPRPSGGNYTPGLPPWMDPKEKGSAAPSGTTGSSPAGSPAPETAPGGNP